MSDISTVKISGPVKSLGDSKERIAFDLWNSLRKETPEKQNEALSFYRKCLKTVSDATTPKPTSGTVMGASSRQVPTRGGTHSVFEDM
jgi:hypothetical protein